ncbi:MAG TPA: hypothetical protein VFW74_17725 [Acidimicrobiia bacterium]|nr:hypothetical protein [Acidimicrobiia bacterium]
MLDENPSSDDDELLFALVPLLPFVDETDEPDVLEELDEFVAELLCGRVNAVKTAVRPAAPAASHLVVARTLRMPASRDAVLCRCMTSRIDDEPESPRDGAARGGKSSGSVR